MEPSQVQSLTEQYSLTDWLPNQPEEEFLRRAKILQATEKDLELQAALRMLALRDRDTFIADFCYIFDPRPGRQHFIPWQLYPHEKMMLKWMDELYAKPEDGLVEKSREMGATWTACVWILYHWLTDTEFSALIGSRVEEDVDNYLPESIFGKLEFLLSNLPVWMLPDGFNMKKHRTFMKLVNPQNGNSITGESSNPNFSRSGRYSVILIDEFAFLEKSQSIWQAAADSSPMRIVISTPNGKGNKFSDLANDSPIRKLTLHWRLHPEKNDAWYESQKNRRTPEEVAQELDISYESSRKGQVYREEWSRLVAEGRLKELTPDDRLPVITSWDFGIGDSTAIIFFQEGYDGRVRVIDYYEESGQAIDHYIQLLQKWAQPKDEGGKGYRYWYHVGDMNIKRRELGTGHSVWETLRAAGIIIRGKKVTKKLNAIDATRRMMGKMEVDKRLLQLVSAIENYHYEWDEDRRVFSADPLHDWSSHAADALSYFAFNQKPFEVDRIRVPSTTNFDRNSTTTYGNHIRYETTEPKLDIS